MSGSDFWSRRRAAVRAEEKAEAEAAQSAARAAEDASRDAEAAEKTDEELLEELGLPDPDSITDGAGARAFLAREVPERLRRRALRRLWRTDPVLACLDGLVDYAEDYRTLGASPGGVKTAYDVGRGMFASVAEAQDATRRESPDPTAAADREPVNSDGPIALDGDLEEVPDQRAPVTVDVGEATPKIDHPDGTSSLRGKRMRYNFDS